MGLLRRKPKNLNSPLHISVVEASRLWGISSDMARKRCRAYGVEPYTAKGETKQFIRYEDFDRITRLVEENLVNKKQIRVLEKFGF